MGVASSKSSQGGIGNYITRSDVLKSTEQPRLMVNRLFSYFVDKFTQKDIISLANPGRCSDYVFVMADALNKLFYELRIEPGSDKSGVIFFRKSSDLTKVDAESSEGQVKKQICLSLAFFYIRIFQIYASLALSVQDDISTGGISTIGRTDKDSAMVAPGFEAGIYKGGRSIDAILTTKVGGSLTGGSTTENILKFTILKNYISKDPTRSAGYFTFDQYSQIIINTKSETSNLMLISPGESGMPSFDIRVTFTIRISGQKTERRLLYFDKFISGNPQYTQKLKEHGPFGLFVNKKQDNSWETDGGEQIDVLINRIMISAKEVALGHREPSKIRVAPTQMPTHQERSIYNIGTPEGLRIYSLLAKLKQVPKPLAHCVARSLQLLNYDALASSKIPTEVRTSICKIKFDTAQGGLPEIGKEITSAPGISALHQLFYDTISQGKPTMSEESSSSYQTFVKKMAEEFSEHTAPQTVHLSSVIHKMDKTCQGNPSKRDKILTVRDTHSIQVAKQAVQTLWKFQIDHDKKVIEILANLVSVSKGGDGVRISLNPLILKTGVPGVNIIAKQARELLINYYKNCESGFRIAAGLLGPNGSAGP